MTKLSSKSIQYTTELSTNNKSKSPLISLILAKTLVLDIPLPTSKVEDEKQYFLMNNKVDVVNDLYVINEIIAIDIDYVLDLILKFYVWKYERFYCKELGLIRSKDTAILDFFDITDHFALSDLETLSESKEETLYHQLNIKRLIDDLKNKETNGIPYE